MKLSILSVCIAPKRGKRVERNKSTCHRYHLNNHIFFAIYFHTGSFLGDIAMSDVEQQQWSQQSNKSATQQEEIEKLKKEVYLDGLQVEEEGLTDMLRKKIKQATNHDDSLKSHSRNDNNRNNNSEKNLNEALIVSVAR